MLLYYQALVAGNATGSRPIIMRRMNLAEDQQKIYTVADDDDMLLLDMAIHITYLVLYKEVWNK